VCYEIIIIIIVVVVVGVALPITSLFIHTKIMMRHGNKYENVIINNFHSVFCDAEHSHLATPCGTGVSLEYQDEE
jgi:hypothetical protein